MHSLASSHVALRSLHLTPFSSQASLARNANNLAALNNRSAAHLRLDQWAAAIQDATGVLASEPRNQKALFRRAEGRRLEAKAKQQQQQEGSASGSGATTTATAAQALALAVTDLEAILRLDPNNADAQVLHLILQMRYCMDYSRGCTVCMKRDCINLVVSYEIVSVFH